MKSFILVVICVLSCCQAIPLDGSEPIIINDKAEQIPDPTTETSHNNKSVSADEKSIKLFPPGPPITSETPATDPTNSAPPVPPITSFTPTVHPTTSVKPTTTDKPPTTVKPTTTDKSTTSIDPTSSTKAPTSTPDPNTTSSVPPTSRPSTLPIVSSTPAVPTNRGFDGPSFIGGIVLAAGLMAIGFVAFKFYKARTELNYHTL